ncbi:WD40 repeat domain-containing serine/threonine protein kinase [Actinomadura rubrisoli]|nr:serine/threonine-protein kinase [Actinomadura rubrisoli]
MRAGLKLAGRYRLEAPLGRGGMGEVWRGIDLRLRRPVAVKLLPLTASANATAVARFRREAEVAATLNHPGITTVFDIDEHEEAGQRLLFLVMELMVGRDLAAELTAHPDGLPLDRVTDWAAQILDALAVAHGQGVVHRDIKPANLFLLDRGGLAQNAPPKNGRVQNGRASNAPAQNGRVKICDFGIARLADATQLTATGGAAGTPLFMAPEQIEGGAVDQRTDLYAFGCVLYEMLTGSTWIDTGSGVGAILYQHLNRVPASPRTLRPEIDADLDALVMDLLAKRPEDRPEDAPAAAQRLHAPPAEAEGGPSRAPVPLALGQTAADASEGTTSPSATPARAAAPIPLPPPAPPPNPLGSPNPPGAPPLGAPPLGSPAPGSPGSASPTGTRIGRRGLLVGGAAVAAATAMGVPAALLLSDRGSGSGRVNAKGGRATGPSASPTPRQVKTEVLATLDCPEYVFVVAFTPDGKTLGTCHGRTVRLWNTATRKTRAVFSGREPGGVGTMAFRPRTTTLAIADGGTLRLWDTVTRKTAASFRTGFRIGDLWSVAVSPDGKLVATAGKYLKDGSKGPKQPRIWNVATGETVAVLNGHSGRVADVAFSPDGRILATSSDVIRLWEVGSAKAIDTFKGSGALAFSPDGRTLATGGPDNTLIIRNLASKRAVSLAGHTDVIADAEFSPDGTLVATGSQDKTVRLWDVATGENVATLTGHSGSIWSVAFSPDGRTLATACGFVKSVWLWGIT